MSLFSIIFQPWKSYLASHFAIATVTVRLVILVHLANLTLALPVKGAVMTEVTTRGRALFTNSLVTAIPRPRCKCHSRSSHRGSQSHTQDLSFHQENSEEGLQYYLRLSAYISHNQKSRIESNSTNPLSQPHHSRNGHVGRQHNRDEVNSQKSKRRHEYKNNHWDDSTMDENIRGQIIIEETWSEKWGLCRSRVCDKKTCQQATINVACVGPCRYYRRHKCPRKYGSFCVTSPDHEGCNNRNEPADHKFPILDIHKEREGIGVETTGQSEDSNKDQSLIGNTGDIDDDDGDDDNDDDNDDDDDELEESEVKNEDEERQRGDNISGKDNNYDKENHHKISHIHYPPQSTPLLAQSAVITPKPSVPQTVRWQDTDPPGTEKRLSNGGKSSRRSDAIASGIRYVWVVSCIVVPTLVFCIGYAIAMHLRRKRFLQQTTASRSVPEGSSDPFLATTAPPYSVEDMYGCPGAAVPNLNLNLPPPSYEVAMSPAEIAASRERTRTLSACSEYLQHEQYLSCSAPAVTPLMPPPPYDDNTTSHDTRPSAGTRGHHRLPSYDSAICLHTSI